LPETSAIAIADWLPLGAHNFNSRVPTGQGKLEKVGICVVRERSVKNIIFEKSGEMILDHTDGRYL